jgi:hypothetical protein
MGWRFRRSIRGPLGLRINLSRRGVGFSEGVRGFRVGRDARGKAYSQTSIPGTGVYRRYYAPGRPGARSRASSVAGIALRLIVTAVIAFVAARTLYHFLR